MTPVHDVVQHPSALAGVEAMTLFTTHAFPRHTHDHYGIGIMTMGAQKSWSAIGHVESEAGDVIMVNPGEMHDGLPAGGAARGWHIIYLEPQLVSRELSGEMIGGELLIKPVARDRRLARQVATLFAHLSGPAIDLLAAEESLLQCLMSVAQRHRLNRSSVDRSAPSVRAAVQRLDKWAGQPTSLAELAALCGMSRFQLLRGFAREVGTTPHAYLLQLRARRARQLLAERKSVADAAHMAGFADQSHLTRAFVRHFGITPGRYQAAIANPQFRSRPPA